MVLCSASESAVLAKYTACTRILASLSCALGQTKQGIEWCKKVKTKKKTNKKKNVKINIKISKNTTVVRV